MHRFACLAMFVVACGGSDPKEPAIDAPVAIEPTDNPAREVVDTKLAIDETAHAGKATITFGPSDTPGATLEIGTSTIDKVTLDGADLKFAKVATNMHLALPASTEPRTIVVEYHFKLDENFAGESMRGYTLVWPYFCGNLFPCHSSPADGTTFSLELMNVPANKVAVFPTTIPNEAPSYQIAWAIDAYTELPVGTTAAGTQISVWHRANEMGKAQQGTANLKAAFEWFETTIGPYKFGPKVGTVSVNWGPGAFGGMEHHPYWHVGSVALADQETNVHEAAHGWFGDGIRIKCWEDFVLSEGTVSYLAGRALDVVAPQVGAAVWTSYQNELASIPGTDPVWPQSCNAIDILDDNLFTTAPYIRGAFFYRALALKLGAEIVDGVLHDFYMAHATKPATMADMLALIQSKTAYDPTACAQKWLRDPTTPQTVEACP